VDSPSSFDRNRNPALRGVFFAALGALLLTALFVTPVTPRREQYHGRWGELYRRAGDAYVNLAYLAVGVGLGERARPNLTDGFLASARGCYTLSASGDPKDAKTALSGALAEQISPGGEQRSRTMLATALRRESRGQERAEIRTVLLAFAAGRPDPDRLAAAEPVIASLAPGPWALSDGYEEVGNASRATDLWDRGWERATHMLPRVVGMLVVCGLVLLAGAVGLVVFLVSRLRGRGRHLVPSPVAWGLREAAEALLLLVVLQLLASALVLRSPRAVEPYLFLLPAVLAAVGAIGWVWYVSPPNRQLGWRFDHAWREVLTGIAAAGVIVLPVATLESLSRSVFGLAPEEHPLVPVLAAADGWAASLFLILGACVIIPALEETLFRGVLYGALRRHVSGGAAVIVSAVVFSAGHLSWAGFLSYLLVGVLLAWLYERSGSLLAPAVAHGAFNAFNVAVLMVLFR
jgi:hypothetical protein